MSDTRTPPVPVRGGNDQQIEQVKELRDQFTRFMLMYKFGIDEISTKINILREEFGQIHEYNPIEHISTRLKSPESIVDKIQRRGLEPSFEVIRKHIFDIAGVRVTCSFVSDTYRVFEMLTSQPDIRVVEVKDYIKKPKPNGYQSLHVIVEVPVFLSTGAETVLVEVQIRTIAMDFWASLEHKIYYKYNRDIPAELLGELKEAAETANRLDLKMEHLRDEVSMYRDAKSGKSDESAAISQGALEKLREVIKDFAE